MPCVHEFGIIPQLDDRYDYQQYEPEKYDMVVVDDDLLGLWYPDADRLPTYFHQLTRPERGLARYGITLIPPESAERLAQIIENSAPDADAASQQELNELCELLRTAYRLDKFVIHYGV